MGACLDGVTAFRVKRPDNGRGPWDCNTDLGTLPAAEALLPTDPACA